MLFVADILSQKPKSTTDWRTPGSLAYPFLFVVILSKEAPACAAGTTLELAVLSLVKVLGILMLTHRHV